MEVLACLRDRMRYMYQLKEKHKCSHNLHRLAASMPASYSGQKCTYARNCIFFFIADAIAFLDVSAVNLRSCEWTEFGHSFWIAFANTLRRSLWIVPKLFAATHQLPEPEPPLILIAAFLIISLSVKRHVTGWIFVMDHFIRCLAKFSDPLDCLEQDLEGSLFLTVVFHLPCG